MKKIGILTLHESSNFGACLQAVATYKVIEQLGGKCEFVNYVCDEIARREILLGEKNEHSFFYRIRVFIKHRDIVKKQISLSRFLKNECSVGEKRYTRKNIELAADEYKLFLVGSDMLWCTRFTNSDYTYMLDFLKDKNKKYSYATSIGFYWEEIEEEHVLSLINQFSQLAVREKDMADVLERKLGRKIFDVCDPTMLLTPDVWKKYINIGKNKKEDYSLVYVDRSDNICLQDAYRYSMQQNMQVLLIGSEKKYTNIDYRLVKANTIEMFLELIYHAQIIFTSSYHGMLFAIYFHIPFVYYNKDSSRLENIAQKLQLANRNGDRYDVNQMGVIDWNKVDCLREKMRLESLNYMKGIVEKYNE